MMTLWVSLMVSFLLHQPEQDHHPGKVKTIERNTFVGCSNLESITLPAGLTSFKDSLENYPADCVFYYNNDETHAQGLFGDKLVGDKLAGHQFLCRCNVTFDANGGTLTDKGGNPTDHAVVSAYKTQKSMQTIWLPSLIPPVRVTTSPAGTPPQMASPKMASLM